MVSIESWEKRGKSTVWKMVSNVNFFGKFKVGYLCEHRIKSEKKMPCFFQTFSFDKTGQFPRTMKVEEHTNKRVTAIKKPFVAAYDVHVFL